MAIFHRIIILIAIYAVLSVDAAPLQIRQQLSLISSFHSRIQPRDRDVTNYRPSWPFSRKKVADLEEPPVHRIHRSIYSRSLAALPSDRLQDCGRVGGTAFA